MKTLGFDAFSAQHLPEEERIQRGGFYTPKIIVDKVHQLIDAYKKHPQAIVFDSSAGGGAFIKDRYFLNTKGDTASTGVFGVRVREHKAFAV